MSRYNPNWGPPKPSTSNDSAGEGQPTYRANSLFGPGDSRGNNSSSTPQPTVSPVADSRPNVPVAPLRSTSTRTLGQSNVPSTPLQASAGRTAPQPTARSGHPQLPYRQRHPQTDSGSRGARSDVGSKGQRTLNVDVTGKHLLANQFPIRLGNYRQVYSYELKISRIPPGAQDHQSQRPEAGNGNAVDREAHKVARQKKKRLVYLLFERLRLEKKLPDPVATDYLNVLIASVQLDEDTTRPREFDFYDEYSAGPVPGCDRYRVTFGMPKLISLANLFTHYRRSTQSQTTAMQLSNEAVTDAINALNVIFSYLPYQRCFSGSHTAVPSMTTVRGQTFYGIASEPAPSRRELGTTDTGKVLDGKGGLYSIPGFSRSVRGSFSSLGYVDLNIYIKTGCFWRHGSVQEMINDWKIQYASSNLDHLQDFLRRAPVRLGFQEQGLDQFSGIKGLARIDRPPRADNCEMRHINQQHSSGLVRDYFIIRHNWQMDQNVYVVKIGKASQKGYMTVPANLLQVIPGRIKPSVIPQFSTRRPEENYQMIVRDGRRTFYSTNVAEGGAAAFRLTLEPDMAKVPVTVLARPNLRYKARGNSNEIKCVDGEDINAGQWNVQGAAFVTPASGKKWSCVELTAKSRPLKCTVQGIMRFVGDLTQALREYGMEGFEWWQFNRNDMSQQQYADENMFPKSKTASSFQKQYDAVEKLLKRLKANGVQLVILLLPFHDLELYGAIKRAGDQAVGVSTVCHVLKPTPHKTLLPKSPSFPQGKPGGVPNHDFLANLCMKINLKVDETAVNQALHGNPKILSHKTMIIGIDVAHGGGPRKHCPSVAAVVGSVNAEFSQWPASLLANPCATQDVEEKEANEKILDLDVPVYERLLAYYHRNYDKDSEGQMNNGIPDQIIVYRDGVSESQFAMCKEYEYGKIQAALSKLFQQKSLPIELLPKVTLICAIKRHHTRLFPDPRAPPSQGRTLLLNHRNKGGSVNNNPLPGCVVMDRITYGQGNDFFLIGQKAIQGTAIPVHYNVLQNPHHYNLQDIARMTYHLCYLFGRSRTSVGPCTPVYYADLVADRARCFVRQFYNPPRDDDNPVKPFDDSELPEFRRSLHVHPDILQHMFYI